MPEPYLVLFCADAADDGHADALREAARGVPGAGFFDDPSGEHDRTVGAYVHVARAGVPAAQALVAACATVSFRLAARLEVQLAEEVLGHLVDGAPDAPLRAALERALPTRPGTG